MISMVASSDADKSLVVRSLITGNTLYKVPNTATTASATNALSFQSNEKCVNAFIHDLQQLRMQKQDEEKQQQQQQLQDVKDYIQQQQQGHLQAYMNDHKVYQERYKALMQERESILQEQQHQQEQLERQQQQQQQYHQQQQQQQQYLQQKRRNPVKPLHAKQEQKTVQPTQKQCHQEQLPGESKPPQTAITTDKNETRLNTQHPQPTEQPLSTTQKEQQLAAEYSFNYVLPKEQANFLNLYNFFAVKFQREAVLQQSATNAGITPVDGLPQISYHLLSELTQELLTSLDPSNANTNENPAHKPSTKPDCEKNVAHLSGELHQHFKQQFLNGFKYYQKQLHNYQDKLRQEETHAKFLQGLLSEAKPNDEQSRKLQKEEQLARAKVKRQAKRLQQNQVKARKQLYHQPDDKSRQQKELFNLLQQQQILTNTLQSQQQQKQMLQCALQAKQAMPSDPGNASTSAAASLINVTGENMPECRIRRTYSCAHCRNVTQNPRLYLLHLRNVHGRCNTIYMCPSCQYATQRCQKFVRHMKSIHGLDDALTLAQSPSCKLPYDGVPPRRRRYNAVAAEL